MYCLDCDDVLTATNARQILMSANYPVSYYPLMDCLWTITGPEGSAITLEIDENFQVKSNFV